MAQSLLETLISYVPPFVTRRIAAHPAPLNAPLREHFPAIALFADISGFTQLTETLAHLGPAGAEELSSLLNDYFGRLIDIITAQGGEVVKFAGDALLALWPLDSSGDQSTIEAAALNAAQCGLNIQATLHNYAARPDVSLSVRIGVSFGNITVDHVGGRLGRWEILLSGTPLAQMSIAQQYARPGEVVLAANVWTLVAERCQSSPGEAGYVRLESAPPAGPARPLPKANLTSEAESALRLYIPGAILGRLAAGQTGWLAELRRVTVLFINLAELGINTPLEHVQTTLQSLQSAIYRYEGSINKISVDDKGITLVAALGLPPLSHEDDAIRGVQAALAIRSELKTLGLKAAIGLATGRAFCGSIGSLQRREYTMIGNVVNLAARLMQAAGAPAEASDPETIYLLCDEATHQLAQAQISFEALPQIKVKGRSEPVSIFRPLTPKKTAIRPKAALVGRVSEQGVLSEALHTLLRHNARGVVIIEGEAGIGKSRLVEELLRQAHALGITSLLGAADAVDKFTPYYAWRPIFEQLFGLDVAGDAVEARREQLLAYLESEAEQLAPLANVVLPLDLPDNELTAQMKGEARANKTNDLLVKLFRKAMSRESPAPRPHLVILEDAHWLDSASWTLVRRIHHDVRPLLLVIATRPVAELHDGGVAFSEYHQLLASTDTVHLRLGSLSLAATYTLACQRLGVSSLPEPVADLIRAKAEGHPFFSEELVYALRDAGIIRIADGKCWINPDAGDLQTLDFPDSVQGVIISRIDRLTPRQQLTLKVASAIGRIFAFSVLRDVHPIESDRPHLAECLTTLDRLDITPLEAPEPDLAYIFKHIITQEVAYNLMAFAQRRQLHRAIAEWYENTHADDLARHFPLLAHHWSKAEVTTKAIHYLEQSGAQALKNNANREAVRFLTEAISLLEGQLAKSESASPTITAPTYRAQLERQLADAYYGLGRLTESGAHYKRALTLLGWPVPDTPIRIGLGLARELGRQVGYRLGLGRGKAARPAVGGPPPARLLEGYRAYERLSEVFFLTNATLLTVYGTLMSLNLAEAIGPSPELARGFASVCVAASLIPFPAAAQHYERLARQTIQNTSDLSALGQTLMVASVYTIGAGQWVKSEETVNRASELFDQLGARDRWEICIELLAAVAYYRGQLNRAVEFSNLLVTSAQMRGDAAHHAWGLLDGGACLLRQGQLDQTVAMAEEALSLLKQSADLTTQIRAEGLLAFCRLLQGDVINARKGADKTAELIAAQPQPTSFNLFDGYSGMTEVYLTIWEQEPALADGDLKQRAAQGCRIMNNYANIFPIGRPRALLYRGQLDWLNDQREAAHQAWQRSLAQAEHLGMQLEAGLAHFELARHLPAEDARRQDHLRQGRELFEQLGAKQLSETI